MEEETEARISSIESTITVLERTLASTSQVASGQALESALSRQISVRKEEIQSIRRRNTSVIVHTSTPNLSQSHSQEASFFGVEEDLVISSDRPTHLAPVPTIAPSFDIFIDPEPEGRSAELGLDRQPPRPPLPAHLSVPRTIPIVVTPDSFEADKENRFEFGNPELTTTMGEDEDPAYAAYVKEVDEHTMDLEAVLEMYEPNLYPAMIVRANQNEWLKEVQASYKNLLITFKKGEALAKDEAGKNEIKATKSNIQKKINESI